MDLTGQKVLHDLGQDVWGAHETTRLLCPDVRDQ
jgi:hypothetical protein